MVPLFHLDIQQKKKEHRKEEGGGKKKDNMYTMHHDSTRCQERNSQGKANVSQKHIQLHSLNAFKKQVSHTI